MEAKVRKRARYRNISEEESAVTGIHIDKSATHSCHHCVLHTKYQHDGEEDESHVGIWEIENVVFP